MEEDAILVAEDGGEVLGSGKKGDKFVTSAMTLTVKSPVKSYNELGSFAADAETETTETEGNQ